MKTPHIVIAYGREEGGDMDCVPIRCFDNGERAVSWGNTALRTQHDFRREAEKATSILDSEVERWSGAYVASFDQAGDVKSIQFCELTIDALEAEASGERNRREQKARRIGGAS